VAPQRNLQQVLRQVFQALRPSVFAFAVPLLLL
jgi:hypothetical protein